MPSRQDLANAIRALSMDAVQQAKSGHPGAPMGMADIAEVLWNDYFSHSPEHPDWFNRDRFILSNGHASILLYSLLHLTGYDLSIDDLKQFRQLDSCTPGHPEQGHTPGVDTTTGPLGQGLANAVGMAIAERTLAAQFNRPGYPVIDHFTYVFLGDGCLMEGISHEVCSLAGTLKLNKLIAFYDDNGISIDGEVKGWFTDDTPKRFESYGWHVIAEVDGHNPDAIINAINAAQESPFPSLICCQTIIGKGSPNKEGKESCHGAPLGSDEVHLAKLSIGWNEDAFDIPEDIYAKWDGKAAGKQRFQAWATLMKAYTDAYPQLAYELQRRSLGELPEHFPSQIDGFIYELQQSADPVSTRQASLNTLDRIGPLLPELVGGSADLAASNLTLWKGAQAVTADMPEGNYLHYGVREFGMSAIMNGIALHGGFTPYGATFLVFMEYGRNAVRMASLMQQKSIFVYTHDSVALGEDGPTHQPIEQLTSLRNTPGLETWRPCDAVETAVSWKAALFRTDGPSALVLSRQSLPPQNRYPSQIKEIEKGAYILSDSETHPDLIILATGSEVSVAMEVKALLTGHNVRVVSMPSTSAFDRQDADYKEKVLPRAVTDRVAIEALHPDFWHKYVGLEGLVIGIDQFGKSGPGEKVMEHFGFSAGKIRERIQRHFSDRY